MAPERHAHDCALTHAAVCFSTPSGGWRHIHNAGRASRSHWAGDGKKTTAQLKRTGQKERRKKKPARRTSRGLVSIGAAPGPVQAIAFRLRVGDARPPPLRCGLFVGDVERIMGEPPDGDDGGSGRARGGGFFFVGIETIALPWPVWM